MTLHRLRGLLQSAVVLAGLLALVPQAASAQSAAETVRAGLSLLKAKDYQGALAKFDAVIRSNPNHRGALFMRGMALNRLGRHAEALAAIAKAEARGFANPYLYYEKGWAAVQTGKWDMALAALERYEKARPGNGKTSELRGRAYVGKGDYDKADALLHEAMARNPATRPTALFYLAILERARGNETARAAYAEQLFALAPKSRLARTLKQMNDELAAARARAERAQTARERKPWHVGASVAVGYNDNVLLLPDMLQTLPSDVSDNESVFIPFSADARYDWWLPDGDVVSAGYIVNGATYPEVGAADYSDHFVFVNYARRVMPDLEASGRVGLSQTFLDSESFRTGVSLRPAVVYRINDHARIEGSYTFSGMDYHADSPLAVRDRDNLAHTLGAVVRGEFPGGDPQVFNIRAGLARTWSDADGDDFDYDAYTFLVGAAIALPWRITADFSAILAKTDYRHRNSLGFNGVRVFAVKRQDDNITGQLRLSRPILDGVDVFAQYQHIDNTSNIGFYGYVQHNISMGLQARF